MLTLGQAALETGMAKSAISRAIKSGRLSARKTETGSFEIDPAELFRVYPPASAVGWGDDRNPNNTPADWKGWGSFLTPTYGPCVGGLVGIFAQRAASHSK